MAVGFETIELPLYYFKTENDNSEMVYKDKMIISGRWHGIMCMVFRGRRMQYSLLQLRAGVVEWLVGNRHCLSKYGRKSMISALKARREERLAGTSADVRLRDYAMIAQQHECRTARSVAMVHGKRKSLYAGGPGTRCLNRKAILAHFISSQKMSTIHGQLSEIYISGNNVQSQGTISWDGVNMTFIFWMRTWRNQYMNVITWLC